MFSKPLLINIKGAQLKIRWLLFKVDKSKTSATYQALSELVNYIQSG